MRKLIAAGAAVAVGAIAFSACEAQSNTSSATDTENKSRMSTYEKLVKNQPAHTMDYSPTRATKNFWIDTWGKPGKLSYVYLLNGQGQPFGYYVFEGLPVTYCTGLVPPMREYKVDQGEYWGSALGPAPSVDGTYSSGSNCSTYYGKDASTGAYIEYTAGFGINPFVYDQPVRQFSDAKPLGDATVDNVKR